MGEKDEGINLETHNSTVITRGKEGWGEVEEGKEGINCDGRRLDLVW